jgi:hypothetical protein
MKRLQFVLVSRHLAFGRCRASEREMTRSL